MEYAAYLEAVAKHFELPVKTGIDVLSISRKAPRQRFRLETSRGDVRARFVVWAGGEMQYPQTCDFHGAELCRHYSGVTSWDDLDGGERCIIGGAESGVDAAVALAAAGRRAIVFDREEPDRAESGSLSFQCTFDCPRRRPRRWSSCLAWSPA